MSGRPESAAAASGGGDTFSGPVRGRPSSASRSEVDPQGAWAAGTDVSDEVRDGDETAAGDPQDEAGGGTILTDVAALAAERDEYLTALQRLKADFDNYRKRVLRQQDEQAARAAGSLVSKLLPVLDNLDLALAHLAGEQNGDVSEEARALEQARAQLLDVLAKEGLERVDQVEVPFDPMVHDAVAHSPVADGGAAPAVAGDGDGDTDRDNGSSAPSGPASNEASATGGEAAVEEVMRAGYRWRGQVLRPAMVRVRG